MAIAAPIAIAIVGAALLTGVRRVAYATLAAVVVAGLWPVVLLVGAFAVLMIVAIVVGLVAGGDAGAAGLGDAGVGVVGGGTRLTGGYFRFVARIRHPAVWGVVVGGVVGTAVVWAVLIFYVIPNEQRTLQTLLHLQQELDRSYQREGRYPPPLADGRAPVGLLADGDSALPPQDAFGHAISYRLMGAWKASSYSLSSLGADGRPGGDDICVTGGTRLGTWLERAAGPVRALWDAVETRGKVGLREGIVAVLASRCRAAR